jgi:hypothetical protein
VIAASGDHIAGASSTYTGDHDWITDSIRARRRCAFTLQRMTVALAQPSDEDRGDPELVVNLASAARPRGTADVVDRWARGGAALPVAGDDDLLARTAETFDLDDEWPHIARYLRRERDLLPVLLDLPAAAREAFGPRTTVALKRFVDRDTVGGEQLVAVIDTPLPRAERRRLLRTFDRSWWLARKRATGSRMFLDSR